MSLVNLSKEDLHYILESLELREDQNEHLIHEIKEKITQIEIREVELRELEEKRKIAPEIIDLYLKNFTEHGRIVEWIYLGSVNRNPSYWCVRINPEHGKRIEYMNIERYCILLDNSFKYLMREYPITEELQKSLNALNIKIRFDNCERYPRGGN